MDFCGKIGFFREGNLRPQGRERVRSVRVSARWRRCARWRYRMQKPPLHGYRTLFTFSIARIRHVARSLALLYSRRIKIEANIAVVLPPARSRGRAHIRVERRECTRNSMHILRSNRGRGEVQVGLSVYADVYAKLTRECERARLPDMRGKIKFGQGWEPSWEPG